jgi:hypothetical protein
LAASPRTYFQQWESYHDIIIISTTIVIAWLDLFQVLLSSNLFFFLSILAHFFVAGEAKRVKRKYAA